MEFSKKKSLFKKSLFLAAGLLAVSLNVSSMTGGMGQSANGAAVNISAPQDPYEGVLWAAERMIGGGLGYLGGKIVSGFSWICGNGGANVVPTISGVVTPIEHESEGAKYFGGANSAAELQSRLAKNSDSLGCIWGHCLPYAKPGLADTKLREIEAAKYQTRLRLTQAPPSGMNPDDIKVDRDALSARGDGLSSIGTCLTNFKENQKIGIQRVLAESAKIDKAAKTGSPDMVDLSVARYVNGEMVRPYAELGKCLEGVGQDDAVVRSEIRSVSKLLDDSKAYEASLRAIDKDLRVQGRASAKLNRLNEMCDKSESPWGCRTKHVASDIADGWSALSDGAVDKAHALYDVDWSSKLSDAQAKVLDYGTRAVNCGTDWDAHPYGSYVIQGGKCAATIALLLVGAYAAYKVGKLSWAGLCKLKNALWTNRSALSKTAIWSSIACTIAALPGAAFAYGYLH
jgi:hypothetical protein